MEWLPSFSTRLDLLVRGVLFVLILGALLCVIAVLLEVPHRVRWFGTATVPPTCCEWWEGPSGRSGSSGGWRDGRTGPPRRCRSRDWRSVACARAGTRRPRPCWSHSWSGRCLASCGRTLSRCPGSSRCACPCWETPGGRSIGSTWPVLASAGWSPSWCCPRSPSSAGKGIWARRSKLMEDCWPLMMADGTLGPRLRLFRAFAQRKVDPERDAGFVTMTLLSLAPFPPGRAGVLPGALAGPRGLHADGGGPRGPPRGGAGQEAGRVGAEARGADDGAREHVRTGGRHVRVMRAPPTPLPPCAAP